jgi:hypothetical protein
MPAALTNSSSSSSGQVMRTSLTDMHFVNGHTLQLLSSASAENSEQ